jgi:hypothetical protein
VGSMNTEQLITERRQGEIEIRFTYSSARAEPNAILTREFQLSGLLYSSER